MKKLLVMISAFILTSVSTNQLVEGMISTNILKPLIKQENKEVEEFKQFKEEKKLISIKLKIILKMKKIKKITNIMALIKMIFLEIKVSLIQHLQRH